MIWLSPPIGLINSFLESTGVGQGIVVVLILMSIVGWTAMGFRWIMYHKVHQEIQRFYSAFRHEAHPMVLFLRQQRFQDCPAYKVYLRACGAALRALDLDESTPISVIASRHFDARDLQAIRDAAERQLAEEVLHLEDDMPIIATVTTAAG